jgi:hypothetical protein
MTIKSQAKEKFWKDEKGVPVPVDRISDLEKKKERYSLKIAKDAIKINQQLTTYKDSIRDLCREVYESVLTEEERSKAKGSFTWYNFDGTIRIEVKINENIDFDTILIEKCKQKLMDIVGESIKPKLQFVKELVLSAFQTSKGKLDTKKIMSLKKYASRIKDVRYQEAMELLDQSIRRPDSKTYFKVSVRDENGAYQNIELNFSSI